MKARYLKRSLSCEASEQVMKAEGEERQSNDKKP